MESISIFHVYGTELEQLLLRKASPIDKNLNGLYSSIIHGVIKVKNEAIIQPAYCL